MAFSNRQNHSRLFQNSHWHEKTSNVLKPVFPGKSKNVKKTNWQWFTETNFKTLKLCKILTTDLKKGVKNSILIVWRYYCINGQYFVILEV